MFRSLKTGGLKIHPIHHRTENRVRAHILLCMLAYYVEWPLHQVWRERLFAGEDRAAKTARDPVMPATRSPAAERKAKCHGLADGSPAHSLRTLLDELATQVRNICRPVGLPESPRFERTTLPNPLQRRAHASIKTLSP